MRKVVQELSKERIIHRGKLFKSGFYSGIGWAMGVTLGFMIVAIILVWVLDQSGGIPLIGEWLAKIIEATLYQMGQSNPIIPQ